MNSRAPSGADAPISAEEWRRLEPIIDQVLDADAARRARLLAELGGDAAQRAELERIVAECEHAYPPLERPAVDRFAAIFDAETPAPPELVAGRYRILREAGRGGMAIVYVARDLRHDRDVAVKVVRAELTAALGRERFLHEIAIAAHLRHPTIVPLYDSGEMVPDRSGGAAPRASMLYYVMPYEAGHSLRERLDRGGALSLDDALLILRDVCEALAHAHQQGIVHLDIKPENVLLAGRRAMVTDFGVARAVTDAATEATLGGGSLVLGTPGYMAPEQAAGDVVDARADIYSWGVLAYELVMASAPPAYASSAAVLDAMHGAGVPEALASLIATCLALRPEDRWQSADALLEQLTRVTLAVEAPRVIDASSGAQGAHSGARIAIAAGLALGTASLVALILALGRARTESPQLRLGDARQLTSDPGLEVQPSLSPDGRRVVYAAGHSLRTHLVVLPITGGKAIALTGDTTQNQWLPRWSPDGARILFLAQGGVFSAPARGGPEHEEVGGREGAIVTAATWSPDGSEIAYVRGDSLLARNVTSGRVRLITTSADLHSCAWSPDGSRLACVSGNSFYVTVGAISGLGPMFGNLAPSSIVIVPARGGSPVRVTDGRSLHQSPAWSRDGSTLYYVSDQQGPRDVYALDLRRGAPIGTKPVRVTTGMDVQSIDLSADGHRIVYSVYRSTANIWAMPISYDHAASFASAIPVTSRNQTIEGLRVTADGRWLVYDSDLSGTSAVYRVSVNGGDAERLTHGRFDAFRGAISPDGRELVYHSFQTGIRSLFQQPLAGGPVQQITRPPHESSMANWSPDGTALTFFDMISQTVSVMRRDSRGRWGAPRVVGGPGLRPEWSPDGRTIAFVSPRDGRIIVVPADSGTQRDLYVPRAHDPLAELAIFSPDGRELYFKSHDAEGRASFWAVPVAGGQPRLLARLDPLHASNRFEFASDGKRFYFTIEDRQSDLWVADIATN